MIKKQKRLSLISKILNILKSMQVSLERKESRLKKNNPNPTNFHKLTPVVDVEEKTSSFYMESLQWAVKEDDCYNIALMGIYGSGKSSIIKSFLTKYNYDSLSVSLANFQEKKTDQIHLEKSIIQQIFYTVKESKLPNSSLKRIKNYKWIPTLFFYLSIIFSAFLLSVLLKPKILCFMKLDSLYENYLYSIQMLAILVVLVFGYFQFVKYRHLARQIGVKLNLQNAEINLPTTKETSIINEYLDELIYFFEKNHRDIIVFEDLDRFDNIEVFSKLRELNLLLNNHEGIKRKGKITFIYAVKDDLFGEDAKSIKTKFFDFILPVISVMNSSNSYAYLKKILSSNQNQELSENFLKNISLYINDLRILKNIWNEYVVYKALIKDLQGITYSSDNFLAMIIYKNYYPFDFNKLLTDEGQLHNVLSKRYKEKLKESYLKKLESREETLKKDVENLADDEKVESEKFSELKNVLTALKGLRSNKFTLAKLVTENGMIKSSEETNTSEKSINIQDDELIQYLIKNAYIDENYQLYISHYVEGGITKNDIAFVINVNEARNEELGFDFKLTFVSEIIEKIQSNRFSNHQLQNFYLVDYLVDKKDSQFKQEVFTTLSQLHSIQLDFVKEYFERGEKTIEFISELIRNNKNFINHLIDSSLEKELQSKMIFDYLLSEDDPNITAALRNNDKLPAFISNSEYLMNTDSVSVEKLGELMTKFKDIKFKELNYSINSDRLERIDKYFLYEVNLNNITVIYNKLYNPNNKNSEDDISPIFSEISANWNSGSLGYVVRDSNFVESAYSEPNIIHDEKEEDLLELLDIINEYENVDEEAILRLLFEKTSTIITDLNDITNVEIQKYLIQSNRIVFNWSNIVSYQNHRFDISLVDSEIEDELIEFIEKNIKDQPLSFKKNANDIEEVDELEDEILFKFKQKVLKDERLDISAFENIIENIDDVTAVNKIEIEDWSEGQIETLIRHNMIKLSLEWIQRLKGEGLETLVIGLYMSCVSDLIKDFEVYNISIYELEKLIIPDKLKIEDRVSLFSKYNFILHNDANKIPKSILKFCVLNRTKIQIDRGAMLSILQYSNTEDNELKKYLAIFMIIGEHSKHKIIEVIQLLRIDAFNSLFDYSTTTQAFQNTEANKKILELLKDRGLIGSFRPRLLDGKFSVRKKKLK